MQRLSQTIFIFVMMSVAALSLARPVFADTETSQHYTIEQGSLSSGAFSAAQSSSYTQTGSLGQIIPEPSSTIYSGGSSLGNTQSSSGNSGQLTARSGPTSTSSTPNENGFLSPVVITPVSSSPSISTQNGATGSATANGEIGGPDGSRGEIAAAPAVILSLPSNAQSTTSAPSSGATSLPSLLPFFAWIGSLVIGFIANPLLLLLLLIVLFGIVVYKIIKTHH